MVSSIAMRSSLAKFHFSQNSTVTLLVPERLTGAEAKPVDPSKRAAALGSPSTPPGTPKVRPFAEAVAGPPPALLAKVGPFDSPIRQ